MRQLVRRGTSLQELSVSARRWLAAQAGCFRRACVFSTVIVGWMLTPLNDVAAQPVKGPYRIGRLTPVTIDESKRLFENNIRALGYVEGKTVVFESRSAENDVSKLDELAVGLVNAKVDVIVAVSAPAIQAARRASTTVPIVMAFWGSGRLLESGMVQSLAHPGGNVTGIYMLATELNEKRLDLLLQAVPNARRIGVLDPGTEFSLEQLKRLAEAKGVQLVVTAVGSGDDGYRMAFEAMARARVDALLIPSFPRFFSDVRLIIDMATRGRMPAIYEWSSMADRGGLIAYGPKLAELQGRVAYYVDRILKGAKPGDLPIEQPLTFELVVNLKAAKAMGLVIPAHLLARADRVIK